MRDAGLVHSDEPATRLLCQGMVVAETFSIDEGDAGTRWVNPSEIEVEKDERGRISGAHLVADGRPVTVGAVEKMSKSRNNGVDPQFLVDRYGADTVRLFSMFASPPDQSLEWSESGVEGAFRFLKRLWGLVSAHAGEGAATALQPDGLDDAQRETRRLVHETIAKVGDDVGRRHTFNTAIAAVMELTNHLSRSATASAQDRAVLDEGWRAIVRLLAPVTPHICEELWALLDGQGSVFQSGWPQPDEAARVKTTVEMVVQVNGKVRARLELPAGCEREAALESALVEPNVQRHLEGLAVRKVIHVPDRLVNIVAN
jgi:leucyl-tRNA synthetase